MMAKSSINYSQTSTQSECVNSTPAMERLIADLDYQIKRYQEVYFAIQNVADRVSAYSIPPTVPQKSEDSPPGYLSILGARIDALREANNYLEDVATHLSRYL